MRVSILVTPFSQEISTAWSQNDHLVVEKTNALLNKGDTELLRGFEDRCVILASSWCSNVFGTRSSGAVDIVNKWELDMLATHSQTNSLHLRRHHWKQQLHQASQAIPCVLLQ
jgi:hypothetical protein